MLAITCKQLIVAGNCLGELAQRMQAHRGHEEQLWVRRHRRQHSIRVSDGQAWATSAVVQQGSQLEGGDVSGVRDQSAGEEHLGETPGAVVTAALGQVYPRLDVLCRT